jgi:hypothetical protein
MERCQREIAAIEAEILAGNPDLAGLCLALSDWSAELRILQGEAGLHEDSRQDREVGGGDSAPAQRAS